MLSQAERGTLESLANQWRMQPHLARRARIILLCGDGVAKQHGRAQLHVREQTAGKCGAASCAASMACTMTAAGHARASTVRCSGTRVFPYQKWS
jgi:hypothetical protein